MLLRHIENVSKADYYVSDQSCNFFLSFKKRRLLTWKWVLQPQSQSQIPDLIKILFEFWISKSTSMCDCFWYFQLRRLLLAEVRSKKTQLRKLCLSASKQCSTMNEREAWCRTDFVGDSVKAKAVDHIYAALALGSRCTDRVVLSHLQDRQICTEFLSKLSCAGISSLDVISQVW